jgi:uncharacterized membrane protein
LFCAFDAVWLYNADRLYPALSSFQNKRSMPARFILAHAICAAAVITLLNAATIEDAAVFGVLFGAYAYLTFNITLAAINAEWGWRECSLDVLYGTTIWVAISCITFQLLV